MQNLLQCWSVASHDNISLQSIIMQIKYGNRNTVLCTHTILNTLFECTRALRKQICLIWDLAVIELLWPFECRILVFDRTFSIIDWDWMNEWQLLTLFLLQLDVHKIPNTNFEFTIISTQMRKIPYGIFSEIFNYKLLPSPSISQMNFFLISCFFRMVCWRCPYKKGEYQSFAEMTPLLDSSNWKKKCIRTDTVAQCGMAAWTCTY